MMAQFCDDVLKFMDPDKLMRLQANLSLLVAHKTELTYATGCSGSDLVSGVFETLTKHVEDQYGISLTLRHLFSAEIVEYKREFIKQHWVPELVFDDVCSSCDETAFDFQSGENRAISTRRHLDFRV